MFHVSRSRHDHEDGSMKLKLFNNTLQCKIQLSVRLINFQAS